MTFKHAKFEDSPVMRSLEKVAQEKGMIKNDPVVKTAAKKALPSLIPSDSLLDNVMRLCATLRERGFVKQAEDVEDNLIAYKQAQTMYGVSKEEGKDLVEFAHPDGSHKLEGVDAKDDGAVFEDILDQMAKSIEVVQKKPTGKLSEAEKAIEAVKQVVGASFLGSKKAGVENIDLAPGLWGRIVSMFGGSSGTIPLAGEGAAAGTAGAAGAAAVGTAASVAAIALSAVVGGYIGYEIFESKFYATDLKKAGDNLLSQYSDVESDASTTMHVAATSFSAELNASLASAGRAVALAQDPKPENLQGVKDYIDHLQEASNYAYKLMSMSREAYNPSGLKPGESGGEHWYSNITHGLLSGFRDVEIAASNFINVAQKGIADARLVLSKIMQGLQAKAAAQTAASGGGKVETLTNDIASLMKSIGLYQARLKVTRPANYAVLNNWLGKAYTELNNISTDFQKNDYKSDDKVLSHYQEMFSDIKNKVNAFEGKYNV
jgi:hypothetical protein